MHYTYKQVKLIIDRLLHTAKRTRFESGQTDNLKRQYSTSTLLSLGAYKLLVSTFDTDKVQVHVYSVENTLWTILDIWQKIKREGERKSQEERKRVSSGGDKLEKEKGKDSNWRYLIHTCWNTKLDNQLHPFFFLPWPNMSYFIGYSPQDTLTMSNKQTF